MTNQKPYPPNKRPYPDRAYPIQEARKADDAAWRERNADVLAKRADRRAAVSDRTRKIARGVGHGAAATSVGLIAAYGITGSTPAETAGLAVQAVDSAISYVTPDDGPVTPDQVRLQNTGTVPDGPVGSEWTGAEEIAHELGNKQP